MNIVLEGPDGSGKSTLARYLRDTLGRTLIQGEGPPKYPGELDERIARMFAYQNVIFDRHPAISGPIYGTYREHNDADVSPDQLIRFYEEDYVFVYCIGSDRLDRHLAASESDSPEYLNWLEQHHASIFRDYQLWGMSKAHITYRIGDPMKRVLSAVRGMLS